MSYDRFDPYGEREAYHRDNDARLRRFLLRLPPPPPVTICSLCQEEAHLVDDLYDGALYQCSSCSTRSVHPHPQATR